MLVATSKSEVGNTYIVMFKNTLIVKFSVIQWYFLPTACTHVLILHTSLFSEREGRRGGEARGRGEEKEILHCREISG